MDEDAPWGSSAAGSFGSSPFGTSASPGLPTLDEFKATTSTRNTRASSFGWGNDDGGWGAPDSGMAYTSTAPSFDRDEAGPSTTSTSTEGGAFGGGGGGWGVEEELPSLKRLSISSDARPEATVSQTEEDTWEPPPISLDTRSDAEAPGRASFEELPPREEDEEPEAIKSEERDDGAWGASPELPPIADAKVSPPSPIDSRSKGWGEDWSPPDDDIPPPLPSFGDAFGPKKPAPEPVVEGKAPDAIEGWGGIAALPPIRRRSLEAHELDEEDVIPVKPLGEGEWADAPSQGVRTTRSIPASLVNGLKADSKKWGQDRYIAPADSWSKGGMQEQYNRETLMEPPNLPKTATGEPAFTNETPLPNLFALTPSLYPAFRTGIAQTASKTAEILKGTNSNAYRTARFGGAGPKVEASGVGDLQNWDLNGASDTPAEAQKGWWNSSGSRATPPPAPAAAPTPSSPQPEQPSAFGRLLGRFKGRGKTEEDPQERAESPVSAAEPAKESVSWASSSFGYLENAPVAGAPPAGLSIDDGLDGLDGFLATTSQPLRSSTTSSQPRTRMMSSDLDLFDPFAADEPAASTSSASSFPALVPGPIAGKIHIPRKASPALPPVIMAPHARQVSQPKPPLSAAGSDSSFFDDMLSTASPTVMSATIAHPKPAPPAGLPPLIARALSPPQRSSTSSPISPPARGTSSPAPVLLPPPPSSSGAFSFAPPPPPSQPLSRTMSPPQPVVSPAPPPLGAFSMGPALTPAPAGLLPKPATPLGLAPKPPTPGGLVPKPAPSPVPRSGSGQLSHDDLSFFESL